MWKPINSCRDVISRALRHAPAAIVPKKVQCGRFKFISITIHIQMHVHNGIKIFSLYVVINMYSVVLFFLHVKNNCVICSCREFIVQSEDCENIFEAMSVIV